MTVLRVAGPAQAFPGQPDEVLIPWDDPPAPVPEPAQGVIPKQLDWEQLDSWLTPNDEFFIVQHYGQPVLNEQDWRLDLGGLAPIKRVEVRIDDGPWMKARLKRHQPQRRRSAEFAWTFWKLDWGTPASGPHTVTSRAFDVEGNQQPAPVDPFLVSKRTYWESNGQITRRVTIP